MNIIQTEIEGLTITPLSEIGDERGAVLHMLRNDAENFTQFGECYFSEVVPGAVKAWKKHTVQTQNLAVPVGRIRLVVYDNSGAANTKGKIVTIELGRPDSYNRVQVPPGVWYGFTCISSTTALLVNCADQPHSKEESKVLDFNDKSIPYSWSEKSRI